MLLSYFLLSIYGKYALLGHGNYFNNMTLGPCHVLRFLNVIIALFYAIWLFCTDFLSHFKCIQTFTNCSLINTQILIYRHVKCNHELWNAPWFYFVSWVFSHIYWRTFMSEVLYLQQTFTDCMTDLSKNYNIFLTCLLRPKTLS